MLRGGPGALIAAWAVLLLAGCTVPHGRPSKAVVPAPAGPPSAREPGAAPQWEPVPVTAAPEVARSPDPLECPLDVELQRAPLPRALAVLSLVSDFDLLISPEVVPPERLETLELTLRLRGATLRAALDWLARMLGANYRVMPGKAVRLYRDEDWIYNEPLVTESYPSGTYAFINHPTASSYNQSGPADGSPPPELPSTYDFAAEREHTLELFHKILAPVEKRCRGTKLLFNQTRTSLIAIYPAFAQVKAAQIIAELNRWRDHSLPPQPQPSALDQQTLRALATPVSCNADGQPFDELIAALARQAEVNIGWNCLDKAIDSRKPITLKLDAVPLAQALQALLPQVGLERYEVEPEHGLWLQRKGDPAVGRAPDEFFWDACVVRSYYVAPLLAGRKTAVLERMIRSAVFPELWKTGPPTMAYHAPTERLVVLQTPAAHDAIAAYLRALAQQ